MQKITTFVTRLRRAWCHLKVLGPREFLRFVRCRLFHGPGFGRIDLFGHYAFLEPPASPSRRPRAVEAGTMVWLVPGFEIGSGGHLNIFRMIANLETLGYRCQICLVGDTRFTDADEARRVIREHFVPLEAGVVLGEGEAMAAEYAVATSWVTAYSARRLPDVRHRLYFIQDFEPWFYPHGSDYVFAEQTYRFGFTGITAGDWLARLVERKYGMRAHVFRFSYDKERYRPLPRRPGPRRVFFYARNVTPRRGFELGMLALARVHELLPEVEFVLAGWDVSAYHIPFPAHNAGVVPLDQLADLYSQCDCALVISLTNVSLLPLELMACGCPVVSNRGENVEWLLRDGDNALLADPDPRSLADALVRLLTDPDLRTRLREGGLACAAATDWQAEARGIDAFLRGIRADA